MSPVAAPRIRNSFSARLRQSAGRRPEGIAFPRGFAGMLDVAREQAAWRPPRSRRRWSSAGRRGHAGTGPRRTPDRPAGDLRAEACAAVRRSGIPAPPSRCRLLGPPFSPSLAGCAIAPMTGLTPSRPVFRVRQRISLRMHATHHWLPDRQRLEGSQMRHHAPPHGMLSWLIAAGSGAACPN